MARNMMHPFLIGVLVILFPLALFLLLAAPMYVGICLAAYLYYGAETAEYFYDPAYMIDLYRAIVAFWREQGMTLDVGGFLLPVFMPLAVGCIGGLWLFYLFARYIRNVFRVT